MQATHTIPSAADLSQGGIEKDCLFNGQEQAYDKISRLGVLVILIGLWIF